MGSSNDIKSQIKRQMEFYFSEGNLPKDQFLQEQMAKSEDGFISLDVFLTFNKIRPLIESSKLLARCLKKSRLLELNASKTAVRRRFPLRELEPVDERTVYVEGLPPSVEPSHLERQFAAVGKVLFVSLPRYRSSGDRKGFGFVEFETKREAKAAVALMAENGPPAGVFPHVNKQLFVIQRRAEALGIDLSDLQPPRGAAAAELEKPNSGEVGKARVCSKRAWLRLRRKHFAHQTAVRREVERRVSERENSARARCAEDAKEERKEAEKEEEEEAEDAISGCVVAVRGSDAEAALTKAAVRCHLAAVADRVAYIDIDKAAGTAYVRCTDVAGAAAVIAVYSSRAEPDSTAAALTAPEEAAYRERLAADRAKKRRKHRAQKRRRREAGAPPREGEEGGSRAGEPAEDSAPHEAPGAKVAAALNGCALPGEDEDEETAEELRSMRGTVLEVGDEHRALSRAAVRRAVAALGGCVAHVDVSDGAHTGHVRCADPAAVGEVRASLVDAGLAPVRLVAGRAEEQYLRLVVQARRAKQTRNAKRKWRRDAREDTAGSPQKRRKFC